LYITHNNWSIAELQQHCDIIADPALSFIKCTITSEHQASSIVSLLIGYMIKINK